MIINIIIIIRKISMFIPKLTIELMMSMFMMMFVAMFMMFFVAKIDQDLYLAPMGAVSKTEELFCSGKEVPPPTPHTPHLSIIFFLEFDKYLEADKAGESEEGEGEGEENHLACDQHHHPPHQELLPAELVVQPLGDQLDVPAHQLPHLGLHLPGKLLLHHRHLHPAHQL